MRRETLIDFFADLASARGVFLVHDNGYRRREHTYADVARASRALAARLHAAGLAKGDAVILWAENRPEWIVALWACLLQGDRGRPDRLPRIGRLPFARRRDRQGQA